MFRGHIDNAVFSKWTYPAQPVLALCGVLSDSSICVGIDAYCTHVGIDAYCTRVGIDAYCTRVGVCL